MHALELPEESDTVFRDVIMLTLLGFMTIVVLLLPHLNPTTEAKATTEPPGSVIVEVRWADELDADVDLWVQAPGDRPVGYSNKGGKVFDLLRDDRGGAGDPTSLNYEVAYGRGAPAGEYTINLHLYVDMVGHLPIDAVVAVSVRPNLDAVSRLIASRSVQLSRVGEEITVVRFKLDDASNLIPNSIHDLPRGLRAARGAPAS